MFLIFCERKCRSLKWIDNTPQRDLDHTVKQVLDWAFPGKRKLVQQHTVTHRNRGEGTLPTSREVIKIVQDKTVCFSAQMTYVIAWRHYIGTLTKSDKSTVDAEQKDREEIIKLRFRFCDSLTV